MDSLFLIIKAVIGTTDVNDVGFDFILTVVDVARGYHPLHTLNATSVQLDITARNMSLNVQSDQFLGSTSREFWQLSTDRFLGSPSYPPLSLYMMNFKNSYFLTGHYMTFALGFYYLDCEQQFILCQDCV